MQKSEFKLIHSNASEQQEQTVIDPALVEARLKELSADLSIAFLREVVEGGLRARNDTTFASPPTAAGVLQWLKTVEVLRTRLDKAGWKIHNNQNCPLISSLGHAVSVVVMTGSAETGRKGFGDPTNQADKGVVVENFVYANTQLELFNSDSFRLAKEKSDETQVWVFLYHYDKKLNEVRFELSFPTVFTKKKITGWGERLILGNIPNNPDDFAIHNDAPNAPINVDVEPKTGNF